MKGRRITAQISLFAALFLLEMAARECLAIYREYIPDSDSKSDFSLDSDIDVSDCSSYSDESDHYSINLQNVRQWCKIDMKNIPSSPPPYSFSGNPRITVIIANNVSILSYFELFF